MKKPHQILIAGAGLVGSLLGLMLGQRGYRVAIMEKRGDMRRKQAAAGRSINLALAERGMHALRGAGLMDEVEPLLIPMRGRMLHELGESENLFSPYGQRPDEVIYSVSRGLLNELMMTAAETHYDVDILFNQSIEKIDFDKNIAHIQDHVSGKTAPLEFELLIGADGVGSEVRTAIMQATGGMYTAEMLDHDYKELTIPSGNGEAVWQMEKEALHIWPRGGYMLIALPNLDGSFTVTLFLPAKGQPSFELIDEPHELDQFFDEQFADAKALIPDFQKEYFSNPQGRLGTVRCDTWTHENKAMLIGDASHGIVPFHGQGMNAGFEDCSELIRLLDKHGDDWSKVMPEFEEIRIPNANAIADMALENYITMRDSVMDDKFQMKKQIGFELEKMYPDRFIPRYSMVMFHRIPYADVFRRGEIQDGILNQLCEGLQDPLAFDRDLAKKLIESEL